MFTDEKCSMSGDTEHDDNSVSNDSKDGKETEEAKDDVPDVGLMCDLLWSDPDTGVNGWAENDRGVSFVFGADVVAAFLEQHDLDLLVRAHQVVEDGYEFFAGRRLVTLFSAPNYCGEFDNAVSSVLLFSLECFEA